MGTDNWSDVIEFSTPQHAVLLIDSTAQCCCTDTSAFAIFWIRLANGGVETKPATSMEAAWDIAIEYLMDLLTETD